jgi:hypothetical protein
MSIKVTVSVGVVVLAVAFIATQKTQSVANIGKVPAESAAERQIAPTVADLPPSHDRAFREGRNRRQYQRTVEGGTLEMPVNLCRIVRAFGGPAGTFRVANITGVTEKNSVGEDCAATYVELSAIDYWANPAGSDLIARIGGGPLDSVGTEMLWQVALRQGDIIGAFLGIPTAENGRYYTMDDLGVFNPNSLGGVSNGQLFTLTKKTVADLGVMVRKIRSADPAGCPLDATPDGERTIQTSGSKDIVGPAVPTMVGVADGKTIVAAPPQVTPTESHGGSH